MRGTGVRDYSFPVLQLITPLQADAALSARRLRQLVSTLRPFGPPLLSTLRLTPSLDSTLRAFGSRFQHFVLRILGCLRLLVADTCLVVEEVESACDRPCCLLGPPMMPLVLGCAGA